MSHPEHIHVFLPAKRTNSSPEIPRLSLPMQPMTQNSPRNLAHTPDECKIGANHLQSAQQLMLI